MREGVRNVRRCTMHDHCPGTANLRTPTLTIKKCPQCGEEVEIFSNDVKVACGNCGFIIYNDITSCIQWCKYAKECVGEEMYRKLVEKKEG
jgi:ribosomal protein S27AE